MDPYGHLSLGHWIVPFGKPAYSFPDNGPQFIVNFFGSMGEYLLLKHLTSFAYHPKSNGQAGICNRTIVAQLRQFVLDHRKILDLFVQLMIYPYNMHVHRSSNNSPFRFILSRHQPGPLTISATS